MCPNHPSLTPEGHLRLDHTLKLQEELMAGYSTEEFQMKLYSGWHATDDIIERHRWRQEACMEVQYTILPRYGFEASRRGVYASGQACQTPAHGTYRKGSIYQNFLIMEWLTNPDHQETAIPGMCSNWMFRPPVLEGGNPSSDYQICLTQAHDDEALRGIARCQGALAGAHCAMYRRTYPRMEHQQWFGVLGCRSVRDALERGVVILHAVSKDTGRVAGYISCTCSYASGRDGKHAAPHAHINNVVVLAPHRGHNLGRMLFNELLDHLSNACPSVLADLRICVAEKNARAKEWYERLGFAAVKEWEAFPSGCRVVFVNMERKLGQEDFDDLFGS